MKITIKSLQSIFDIQIANCRNISSTKVVDVYRCDPIKGIKVWMQPYFLGKCHNKHNRYQNSIIEFNEFKHTIHTAIHQVQND